MIKSILTPTRNRPNNCERFIKSVYNSTRTRKNVEMLFYVDNDDPAINSYKSLDWHAQKEYEGFKKIEFAYDFFLILSIFIRKLDVVFC